MREHSTPESQFCLKLAGSISYWPFWHFYKSSRWCCSCPCSLPWCLQAVLLFSSTVWIKMLFWEGCRLWLALAKSRMLNGLDGRQKISPHSPSGALFPSKIDMFRPWRINLTPPENQRIESSTSSMFLTQMFFTSFKVFSSFSSLSASAGFWYFLISSSWNSILIVVSSVWAEKKQVRLNLPKEVERNHSRAHPLLKLAGDH